MWALLHSVGGSRLNLIFGLSVDANVTPLFKIYVAYFFREGHRQLDSLAGVAHCWKDINSAQWLAQLGQKSSVECKGKSQPDWILNKMEPKIEILA